MAKKDFEKLKKLKKKNYYSNAKLNVINILNNCINEDFYDEFSIIEKNCSKNDDKKIKKEKKNRMTDSCIKYYNSDKSTSFKFVKQSP